MTLSSGVQVSNVTISGDEVRYTTPHLIFYLISTNQGNTMNQLDMSGNVRIDVSLLRSVVNLGADATLVNSYVKLEDYIIELESIKVKIENLKKLNDKI